MENKELIKLAMLFMPLFIALCVTASLLINDILARLRYLETSRLKEEYEKGYSYGWNKGWDSAYEDMENQHVKDDSADLDIDSATTTGYTAPTQVRIKE